MANEVSTLLSSHSGAHHPHGTWYAVLGQGLQKTGIAGAQRFPENLYVIENR